MNPKNALKIADIGCGTGASTLVLAETLECEIVAVDFIPEFLETLSKRASKAGFSNRVVLKSSLMEALPFNNEQLDAFGRKEPFTTLVSRKVLASGVLFLRPVVSWRFQKSLG